MAVYEDGRIRHLAENLQKYRVSPEVIEQVMAGGEQIKAKAKPEQKIAWLREAMHRMDHLIDTPTRLAVREACACCLGAKRGKLSTAIGKDFATLEERIQAANETHFVFGHSVEQLENGKLLVQFAPEGQESYGCACLPKFTERVSITYCYCCAGHVRHHLQNALQRKLSVKVKSSALSSGGTRPCHFLLTIEDN